MTTMNVVTGDPMIATTAVGDTTIGDMTMPAQPAIAIAIGMASPIAGKAEKAAGKSNIPPRSIQQGTHGNLPWVLINRNC